MALLFPFYISVKNRHSISHWYHTWYHIDTAFLWLIHLFVNKTNRWPPSVYVKKIILDFISNLLYLLAGSGNSTWHDTESRDTRRSRRIFMLAKLSCFVSLVRVAASPIRVHRARVILSILWGSAVRRPMLRHSLFLVSRNRSGNSREYRKVRNQKLCSRSSLLVLRQNCRAGIGGTCNSM